MRALASDRALAACSPDIVTGAYVCGPERSCPAERGVRRPHRHVRARVECGAVRVRRRHRAPGRRHGRSGAPDPGTRLRVLAVPASTAACPPAMAPTGSSCRRRRSCSCRRGADRAIQYPVAYEHSRLELWDLGDEQRRRQRHRRARSARRSGARRPLHQARRSRRAATTASPSSRRRQGTLRRRLRLQSVRSDRAARHAGLVWRRGQPAVELAGGAVPRRARRVIASVGFAGALIRGDRVMRLGVIAARRHRAAVGAVPGVRGVHRRSGARDAACCGSARAPSRSIGPNLCSCCSRPAVSSSATSGSRGSRG